MLYWLLIKMTNYYLPAIVSTAPCFKNEKYLKIIVRGCRKACLVFLCCKLFAGWTE